MSVLSKRLSADTTQQSFIQYSRPLCLGCLYHSQALQQVNLYNRIRSIMNAIKTIALVPVYMLSAWLMIAGTWKTVELYHWTADKAEQVQRTANVLNIFNGAE